MTMLESEAIECVEAALNRAKVFQVEVYIAEDSFRCNMEDVMEKYEFFCVDLDLEDNIRKKSSVVDAWLTAMGEAVIEGQAWHRVINAAAVVGKTDDSRIEEAKKNLSHVTKMAQAAGKLAIGSEAYARGLPATQPS